MNNINDKSKNRFLKRIPFLNELMGVNTENVEIN